MKKAVYLIAIALLMATIATVVRAQDDDSRRSELGERQRLIERKMAELETRFEIIAHKLESKEPERAQRLVEALQQAKRDLIAVKMGEITDLLDQSRFQQAEAELDLVIIKLDQLVRLLLNDKEETMTRQQEIDKLQKWKDELSKIKSEEQLQNRETEKVANKDVTLKKLAGQIAAIEELLKKQQEVLDQTEAQGNAGLQALDRVANEQFEVRQQTEELAKEIAGAEAVESPPGELPVEKSGESKSGESKSGEPESGESENPKPDGEQPKQPGEQPLESAARNQKQAEQDLADGKPVDAKRAEEKALDDLSNALGELKKEERRIASLPPEAFKEMARKQQKTESKTADLSRDMEQAPKPSESAEGKDGKEGGAGKPGQPGQQSVQRAQKAMQNASDDLNDEEPQGASRQQQKSVEELEKALREIEERLDQLREETREEKLARLEARFREMLARQQIASLVTIDIDEKKVYLNRVRRRDVLGTMRLSSQEREISELGRQAYDLLLEDGTSIVFPEMVQVILDDLERVAQMLESEQTGLITQMVQREIELSLEELMEALKKSRQDSAGSGGGGGGGGGNQPLLRKSAELKMLRSAQLRVNRLTQQFDLIRGSDTLEQGLLGELDNIRVRQADIVEMMMRIMEKQ